jgi:hypothetical protein
MVAVQADASPRWCSITITAMASGQRRAAAFQRRRGGKFFVVSQRRFLLLPVQTTDLL